MKFTSLYETSHFILNTLNNTTKMAPLVTPVDVYCLFCPYPSREQSNFHTCLVINGCWLTPWIQQKNWQNYRCLDSSVFLDFCSPQWSQTTIPSLVIKMIVTRSFDECRWVCELRQWNHPGSLARMLCTDSHFSNSGIKPQLCFLNCNRTEGGFYRGNSPYKCGPGEGSPSIT